MIDLKVSQTWGINVVLDIVCDYLACARDSEFASYDVIITNSLLYKEPCYVIVKIAFDN